MLCISAKEFLFWKKKQLSKGGNQQSFAILLDCIGGIATSDLNLIILNPHGKLHLKKNFTSEFGIIFVEISLPSIQQFLLFFAKLV